MEPETDLDIFFGPESVAIIGATERPGSWGSIIMESLLSRHFQGRICPVNLNAKAIHGVPAYRDIREIPGAVDLAILTIPQESVEQTIAACGEKEVKGVVIVTSGFGETSDEGMDRERAIVNIARGHGVRILGPNVSGVFNLHKNFVASGARSRQLKGTSLAAASQGGFAFQDLLAAGANRGMGVGKFVHTGNESDLTVTEFLEYYSKDKDVKAVLLYIESIRDGRRFIEVARRTTERKPVIVYKAGRTGSSSRAAHSHTAALTGNWKVYQGLFNQVGIILSPTMELLLPLGHALVERPPLLGKRIGIVTMGGSWGVVLSDSLEEAGLTVPELSPRLQERLHYMGMPARASTRNPIDIGAAGPFPPFEMVLSVGREVLTSGEIDGLVLHGIGRPGKVVDLVESGRDPFLDFEIRFMHAFVELEKEISRPVLIGNHHSPWESQAVHEMNKRGTIIYNRVDDIAAILARMHKYWERKR